MLKLPRYLGGRTGTLLHSAVFLLVVLCLPTPHFSCLQTERDSLLSFLSNLSTTSQAALSSWVATKNLDCCLWDGIECVGGSIVALSLPYRGLQGRISPGIAGLTRLARLDLSHNSLAGQFDAALLMSRSLEVLDLSFNSLSGPLPSELPSTLKLKAVNISSNRFNGSFPPSWLGLQELQALNCSNNSFSGVIPSGICSAYPQLQLLDLSLNGINGKIPAGLGNCSKLRVFRAGYNNLTGEIPTDLYEALSLQLLSLPSNHLTGKLDGERITNLSDLVLLDLSWNRLNDMLPDSIGKLTKLEHLVLNDNNLTGPLPSSLHNCTRLRCLILRENNFSGNLSAVDFSSLLDLETLDLGNNNFTGSLPASIYSCRSLTALRLAKNSLEGEIAPQLVNLASLSFLSLSANKLRNISAALKILSRCKNLTTIVLSTNFIGESMPTDILEDEQAGGFINLRVLGLANCRLIGQVPPWFSNLHKLEVLDLSLNMLTGPLPGWLGNLTHLFYIDLSENKFESGAIPIDLMKLRVLATKQTAAEVNRSSLPLPVFYTSQITSLQYNQLTNLPAAIYLRNNSLEGAIPPEIGQLVMLQVLDLSKNNLSGGIPVQISNLANLQKLVLSENQLSGSIPRELLRLSFLSSFNVSYNNLSGPIPRGGQFDSFASTSFEGNPGLCGMAVNRPCKNESSIYQNGKINNNKKLITGIIIGICFGGASVFTLFVLFMLSRRKGKLPEFVTPESKDTSMVLSISVPDIPCDEVNNMVVLFPGNSNLKSLTVSEIFKATNNFSQEFIIGCGGFGLVYRAVLSDGTKLAVKRLSGETGIMEREFKAEVEALSNARHENLVSLQGYSIHGSFRFLLYSYMDNGSLDYWLHEKVDGASALTWPIRLEIARGTSRGLAYIHQICEPHIVHRDIKSSNILLDCKFQAHVADFGLSRLILPTNTHVSTELVGTLGYIPPEYGQAWIATLRGDIYSFGVVMLELLTGRRPFEVFKPKQSRDVVGWVQQLRGQGKPELVFDPLLKGNGFDDQMLQVLDVACLCVSSNPFKRPTIRDIVYWLDNVGANQ